MPVMSAKTVIASTALALGVCVVAVLLIPSTAPSPQTPASREVGTSEANTAEVDLGQSGKHTSQSPTGAVAILVPDSQEAPRPTTERPPGPSEAFNHEASRPAEQPASGYREQGSGYPSAAVMWELVDHLHQAAPTEWRQVLNEELTKRHRKWTRKDVLDRYGAPTAQADPEKGIDLGYNRDRGSQGSEWLRFAFDRSSTSDRDLVTSVYVEE